jgi:LysR family transcriptional regulator, hydrogen peroxide-inducible genes activator
VSTTIENAYETSGPWDGADLAATLGLPTGPLPSLIQLRAFVAAAELGSVTDAAAVTSMSQPAVSQSIAALEEVLGVVLLDRLSRGVRPTPAGAQVLPQARAVLNAANDLLDAVRPFNGPLRGLVRIGVIPTVAPYLLPAALAILASAAPDLIPEIHEDRTPRLREALADGSIDVALLAAPAGDRLESLPLYDEEFQIVVPNGHAWAGRSDVTGVELSEADLLLLDEGHCLRDQALDVCRTAGHDPSTQPTRASSLGTLTQLVGSGLGVSLLPTTAVPVETRRAPVELATFAAPVPGRRIVLAYRGGSNRAKEWQTLAQVWRDAIAGSDLDVTVIDPA